MRSGLHSTLLSALLIVLFGCSPGGSNASQLTGPEVRDAMEYGIDTGPTSDEIEADAAAFLVSSISLTNVESRCVVSALGPALPQSEFVALRFADAYTTAQTEFSAAFTLCVASRSRAALLSAPDDDILRVCISTNGDEGEAIDLLAAVAAGAVGSVAEVWAQHLTVAAPCATSELTSEAVAPEQLAFGTDDTTDDVAAALADDGFTIDFGLDPEAAEALGVRVLPFDPHARVVALGATTEQYEITALEPNQSGYDIIAEEVAENRAAGAFELRRPNSTAPEGLAWVIAWDPTSASDVTAATDWLASIREGQQVSTLAGVDTRLQQLIHPSTGLTMILITGHDTAMLIADTGGGPQLVDYYLAALG